MLSCRKIAAVTATIVALAGMGGSAMAAGVCRGSKVWGFCNATDGNNMMSDYSCVKMKVPCSFEPSNPADSMFASFRYPIIKYTFNVPADQIDRYEGIDPAL